MDSSHVLIDWVQIIASFDQLKPVHQVGVGQVGYRLGHFVYRSFQLLLFSSVVVLIIRYAGLGLKLLLCILLRSVIILSSDFCPTRQYFLQCTWVRVADNVFPCILI